MEFIMEPVEEQLLVEDMINRDELETSARDCGQNFCFDCGCLADCGSLNFRY